MVFAMLILLLSLLHIEKKVIKFDNFKIKKHKHSLLFGLIALLIILINYISLKKIYLNISND